MPLTLEESREYQRLRYLAFSVEILARAARWVKNNPEKKRASDRRWAKNNSDRVNANGRKWWLANPEKRRAILKRYNHSKKGRVARHKWNRDNSDYWRAKCVRRRARQRNALLPGDQWEINKIYKRADELRRQGFDVAVDHIYPLGFGWHEPANLRIVNNLENSQNNFNPNFTPSKIFT